MGIVGLASGCTDTPATATTTVAATGMRLDSSSESHDIAQSFGDDMLKGDWAGARTYFTKSLQDKLSSKQLSATYEKLAGQLVEITPSYKPTVVQVKANQLPLDPAEAKADYGVSDPPKQDSWRGAETVTVGQGYDHEVDQGVSAKLFIVDEGGKEKIADVQLGLFSWSSGQ
ncbi:MAG TPA: hypothetical protein VG944_03640 [Fimbriimonas sp.]|nr:hypothetical protein [Fimbriimonas sp.]